MSDNIKKIKERAAPVFKKLLAEISISQPKEPVPFMINYLRTEYNYTSSGLTISERAELEHLRKEINKYRQVKQDHTSDKEDSEEEDEVYDPEALKAKLNKEKKTRIGVSAEAYGDYNKKEDFVPRVIKKSEEQVNRIKTRIMQSFLFSSLDPKELDIVIDAMEEKKFEWIYKQKRRSSNQPRRKRRYSVLHRGRRARLLQAVCCFLTRLKKTRKSKLKNTIQASRSAS